jgi:hypothetical protein
MKRRAKHKSFFRVHRQVRYSIRMGLTIPKGTNTKWFKVYRA